MSTITIRTARDTDALARLAALDSAAPVVGDALVAEACGQPVAALEIATGRTVADPFRRTSDVVELLRLRARGTRERGHRRRRARFLPRPA